MLTGCKSLKTKKRAEIDTKTTETSLKGGFEKTTRPADTSTIYIPNLKLKDTVIYRETYRQKHIIEYDKQGNQSISSICDEISQIRQWYQNDRKEQEQQTKTEEKDKQIDYTNFLYIGIVFLLILILAIFIALRYLKGIVKAYLPPIN